MSKPTPTPDQPNASQLPVTNERPADIATSQAEHDLLAPDRAAKFKKLCATGGVAVLAVAALASFLFFGKLLHGYVEFAETKTAAQREIADLEKRTTGALAALLALEADAKTRADRARETEAQFDKRIAEREGKIRAQQTLVDKHTALSAQIATTAREHETALGELKKVRETVATEKGSVAGLQFEITILNNQRSELQKEVAALAKEKASAQESSTLLVAQATENRKAATETKTSLTLIQNELATFNEKLAQNKKENTTAETELQTTQKTLSATQAAVAAAKEELRLVSVQKAAEQVAITKLSSEKLEKEGELSRINNEIISANREKTTSNTMTADAKKSAEIASADLILTQQKLLREKSEYETLQGGMENLKIEYNTQAGRLGALQEAIRIKESENLALEKRLKAASDGAKYWESRVNELKTKATEIFTPPSSAPSAQTTPASQ